MRIGSSSFVYSLRHSDRTRRAIERSLEQLASGNRLSSARSDIASLASSERLKASSREFGQLIRASNDIYSSLSVSDSVLASQLELVQRMRELSVQASNGVLQNSDREALDQEFQSLLDEYDRMTSSAEFNGQKLLDGSRDRLSLLTNAPSRDVIEFELPDLRRNEVFDTSLGETIVGTGSFTDGSPFGITAATTARLPMVIDINGDSFADVVIPMSNGNVAIRLGNGTGSFATGTTLTVGGNFQGAEAADLDGDSDVDLVLTDFATGNVSIQLNNGNGTFVAGATLVAGTSPRTVKAVNLNGDAHLDLVVANSGSNSVSIFLGAGAATYIAGATVSLTGASVNSLAVGNADGDADIDLFVGHGTGFTVLLNSGTGAFSAPSTVLVGGAVASNDGIELGDVDGDSDLDVVVSNITGDSVETYLNNGSGSYTIGATLAFSVGTTLRGIHLGDLNGDGNLDLVASTQTGAFTAAYVGDGTGAFTHSHTFTPGGNNFSSALGDLNGDGVLDVILATSLNSVPVYLQTTTVSDSVSLSIRSSQNASNLLLVLDGAIDSLSSARASLGAQMARLESIQSHGHLQRESVEQGLSQLRDVDFAEETANLIRLQTLQQAQTAVMVQSNLALQTVLNLLRI